MQTPTVHRKVRRGSERTPFRRRHPQRPTSKCAHTDVANGLAGHTFKPLLREDAACLEDWQRKEREFFNSLSFLANLYGFEPPGSTDHSYPVNIIRALEIATGHVQKIRPYTELIIFQDDNQVTTIGTKTWILTGSEFYYIPLQPLDKLWKKQGRSPKAELLASVMAYAHHVLKIQTFTNKNAFLYYYYDMMRTPEEIYGMEDTKEVLEASHEAFEGGKRAGKILRDKSHLRQLADRIKRFQPADKDSTELHRLAIQAGELHRLYPKRSIRGTIPTYTEPPDEGYMEESEPLQSYQMVSFCWETEGLLADKILEWINGDLQETAGADPLTNHQLFDKPQPSIIRSLDFEEKIFDLLNRLIIYLNTPSCAT